MNLLRNIKIRGWNRNSTLELAYYERPAVTNRFLCIKILRSNAKSSVTKNTRLTTKNLCYCYYFKQDTVYFHSN